MKKIFIIVLMILIICPEFVHAGTWKKEAIGGFSDVYIYAPESLSPIGSGRSLLIALHGCLQTNEAMEGAKWEEAADQYGMVVALPEAMYKEGLQCWGYWTSPVSRNSKDYKNIHNLVNELLARSEMNIDKDQVYIAGLSSGGAFTMNIGCMMPDIFAGIGIDAGPSVGTDSSCAIGQFCGTVDSTVRACRQLGGSYKSYFDTQITSTAYGTTDYTVDQRYAYQNAQAMAKIYDAQKEEREETIHEGSGGTITTWSEKDSPVVSMAKLDNIGHAWPGGKGASGAFVDSSGFNYGAYLAEFFTKNNRRIKKNTAPDIQIISSHQMDSDIVVEGKVNDPDPGDTISSVKITFLDGCNRENVLIPEEEIVSNGTHDVSFSHKVRWPVNNKAYISVIFAADSKSPPASKTIESDPIKVGTPSTPPSISISQKQPIVEKECTGVSISGEAKKGTQQLDRVQVRVDSGNFEDADGTINWEYKKCNLDYGKHTILAKVIDGEGCFSYSKVIDINISIPYQQKTGNTISLLSHYETYPNEKYPDAPSSGWGLCDKSYVELNNDYGIYATFTIYGTEDSEIWCFNPTNIPASIPETGSTICKDWKETNSVHEKEGRAKSYWYYSFPLGFSYYYYAVGSNESLGKSSDETVLRQKEPDKAFYERGKCPQTN
jgi:poly(3-hydroxybutyrate) depolymerase